MIRIIYGDNGHALRNASPVKIDVRDLEPDGRPHPSLLPVGAKIGEVEDPDGEVLFHVFDHVAPTVLAPGEREFDHALTPAELEKEFPGYAARNAERARIKDIRTAAANAGPDDEIAALVKDGTVKAADLHDLALINARRQLRSKPPIA